MDNPWSQLPAQSPFVLEIDRKAIDQYNQSVHDHNRRVVVESIPEPFIGNPTTAKVV
jgi:hypothetical protein